MNVHMHSALFPVHLASVKGKQIHCKSGYQAKRRQLQTCGTAAGGAHSTGAWISASKAVATVSETPGTIVHSDQPLVALKKSMLATESSGIHVKHNIVRQYPPNFSSMLHAGTTIQRYLHSSAVSVAHIRHMQAWCKPGEGAASRSGLASSCVCKVLTCCSRLQAQHSSAQQAGCATVSGEKPEYIAR